MTKPSKEITMASFNSNMYSNKFKHLSEKQIEYVISAVSHFEASHKNHKRSIGKCAFIKGLALDVGSCVATIYNLLKIARIETLSTHLTYQLELSHSAAIGTRLLNRKLSGKNHKIQCAKAFIDLVCAQMKNNTYVSIDETIQSLRLHHQDQIAGMTTICTKTFYNYVHQRMVDIKPIDLPRMLRRKKKNYKTYIPKAQKGTSIDERGFEITDRTQFGHWEGDLVTGPRDGQNGALFTLIERSTRFYYAIPIKSKTSRDVYRAINKLEKLFGEHFKSIFKSITFDNGSEVARFKDIEKKPGHSLPRTKVYFAHPYCSYERGSNENCNGLVRYTITKGTDMNTIPKQTIRKMNEAINNKPRRIHNYVSSTELFINNLLNITQEQFKLYDFISAF